MKELVLCQNAEIASFINLPIIAGITTSRLGNFHSDEPNIEDNYRTLLKKFNCSSFVQMVPNHGENVLNPSNYYCGDSANFLDGDGIIYGDSTAGYLALAHCSWKTLAEDIIEKTAKHLYLWTMKPIENFSAFIYPGICQDCYEVGADVYDKFSGYERFCKPHSKEKWLMNLAGIIQQKLISNGILPKNIISVEFCSAHSTLAQLNCSKQFGFSDEPVLYSYRRRCDEKRNIIFASLPGWPCLVSSTTGDCPYVIFYQTK